ncbi:MAG: zinc-dependent alcohol dehydrogenase [Spirochaetota bacterium]
MTAKCIVFSKPETVEIGELEMGSPGPDQILTKTLMTGVSTGTETRVYRGKQERSEFPLIPGYENLGEVIEAGEKSGFSVGQRAFVRKHQYDSGPYQMMWGSQVSHSLSSSDAAIPIPDGVATEDAIYAKVSAISLHGVKRARVAKGEWVAVVGLGIIGHFVVQHCVARGAKVIAIDLEPSRREKADEAGAEASLDGKAPDLVERVHQLSGGGVNIAFDATGIAKMLEPTSRLLRHRLWDEDPSNAPRLVLQGTVEDPVTIDYMALFRPELDLITPRDCDTQDMVDSLDLMAAGKIKPSIIPATIASIEQAPELYPKLVSREIMRVLFRWSE